MELTELKDLNSEIRKAINEFLDKEKMTLAKFCRIVGCHQSQMWIFLNDNGESRRGLNTGTLEKIGRSIENYYLFR